MLGWYFSVTTVGKSQKSSTGLQFIRYPAVDLCGNVPDEDTPVLQEDECTTSQEKRCKTEHVKETRKLHHI
jgi:hypothetical protein